MRETAPLPFEERNCLLTANLLTATLVEVLETMAFISPQPLDESMLWGVHSRPAYRVNVPFEGPVCGFAQINAPCALGHALVESLFGDSAGPVTTTQAEDALMELGNVVCGLALRKVKHPCGTTFSLRLPSIQLFKAPPPGIFESSSDTIALSVEGMPVSVRMVITRKEAA